MHKKDYIAIAKIIKGIDSGYLEREGLTEIEFIMHKLCDYFEKDNQKFNKEKFIEACGFLREAYMKYYEVYLEPLEREFIGVVKANNKEDAEESASNGDENFIENFRFGMPQRSYVLKKISKKEFEQQKLFCKSR